MKVKKWLPYFLLFLIVCMGIGGTIRLHYPYLIFSDSDHSPTVVGQILYDNLVSGWDDGSWAYYDDDEIKYLLSTNQIPTDSEDDYVWAYDKDTDKNYLKQDAGAAGGDSWSDPVDSDIIPDTDDTYDIGSAAARFKDGYFHGTLEGDVLTENGNAVPNVTDHLGVFGGTTSA